MTDDDFLRALLAHPDDETRWLVYADWLEERGDVRGDFIRKRIEWAHLPPGDRRIKTVQARLDQLRSRVDAEWLAEIEEPGQLVEVSADQFSSFIQSPAVVILFWAAWSSPDRTMRVMLSSIAGRWYPWVRFGASNIDEAGYLERMMHFQINAIPALLYFCREVYSERTIGLIAQADLEDRLRSLLHSDPAMP